MCLQITSGKFRYGKSSQWAMAVADVADVAGRTDLAECEGRECGGTQSCIEVLWRKGWLMILAYFG